MGHLSRSWLPVSLVVLFFASAPSVPAQDKQLGEKADADRFSAGLRNQFVWLLKGKQAPAEKDKKIFDLASRFYVYRVTWPFTVQRDRQAMEDVRKDFKREIDFAAQPEGDNRETLKQIAPLFAARFKEVFDLPAEANRLALLNAALMLPDLARLKQPVIADLLVSLLEDPKKHDSVKLYAAKALAEFFPATEFTFLNQKNKAAEAKRNVDLRRVNALLAFVMRKWDESQADKEAFRYVRRVALRALAEARVPAVEVDEKMKKVSGPAVQAYLAVLKNDGLVPEANIAEKLEAAIGICQMKIDPTVEIYQPQEGIYRVGLFLVELGTFYRTDHNAFAGQGKIKSAPRYPWKLSGKRLSSALAEMVAAVKNNPNKLHQDAAERARKLEKAAIPLLVSMQGHTLAYNIKDLAEAVTALRPETPQVFRGIEISAGGQ